MTYYNLLNLVETIPTEKYCKEIDKMHQELQCLGPTLENQKETISMTLPDHMSHDSAVIIIWGNETISPSLPTRPIYK